MLDGEVGEELLGVSGAEGVGMLEAIRGTVEADGALDPVGVAVLGAAGQVAEAGDVTGLVKQLHGAALPMQLFRISWTR
jgi:hypothetical protein